MTDAAPVAQKVASQGIAHLTGVHKSYYKPDGTVMVHALRGIDLSIPEGEFVAIMGSSGSGKSTLMNILGCLDRPEKGQYALDGFDVRTLPDDDLSKLRGRKIGFIFQAFNLIPELSIEENVEVPMFYQGMAKQERRDRAIAALESVSLTDRLGHRPRELSGGQQQRVAIARALAMDPRILMADEPTGNLDSATGEAILQVIEKLHQKGMTIIMVTHDDEISHRCQRVIRMKDGEIDSDHRN